MTKITAPVAQEGQVIGVGGLVFTDGVADTDDEAIIAYCENAGYGIGNRKPVEAEPEPLVDSREVHANGPEMVGTPLRDASVDPHEDDYLAPVNAGKADPHGPLVVAPEIHNSGRAPVVPGAVTEAKETEAAKRVLVDGGTVHEVTADMAGDDEGPLGLSDPSSGEFAATGVADSDGAVKPAKKTAAKKTASSKS